MLQGTMAKGTIPKKMSKKMTFLKRIVRACLLASLVASFAIVRSLHAQEPSAPPQKPQQSDDSSKQPGFARQLTHETREAAGEEKDDKAQFKESPSVQFIARHTGLSTGAAYFLSVLLNFAVIAGLIFWASLKYLPDAFSARTAAIQKAMQEAQKSSDEARRRLAEIESRLMRLDGEIGMMRDAAEKEAAAEEARIQAAEEQQAIFTTAEAAQALAAEVETLREQHAVRSAEWEDLATQLEEQATA